LSSQANSGSASSADRATPDQELGDMLQEIDRIARSTTFNGVRLLDGTGSSIAFQVGTGATAGVDTIRIGPSDTLASTLGLATLDIGAAGNPTVAIGLLDVAID